MPLMAKPFSPATALSSLRSFLAGQSPGSLFRPVDGFFQLEIEPDSQGFPALFLNLFGRLLVDLI